MSLLPDLRLTAYTPTLLLAVWLALPMTVLAQPGTNTDSQPAAVILQQRTQQIADMTMVERERLRRNWETFQKLPPAEQNRYRQMHQELQAEPELRRFLQTYGTWLLTLSAGQRQELREETDTAKKVALIRRIKSQQDEAAEVSPIERLPQIDGSRLRRPWRGPPPPKADSAKLFLALESELPASMRQGLEGLTPANRAIRTIEASVRQSGGQLKWPTTSQQTLILESILDTNERTNMLALHAGLRRFASIGVLLGSLHELVNQEVQATLPSQDQLQKVFESLEPTERDQLMQLAPHELSTELSTRYYNASKTPEIQRARELQQTYTTLISRIDFSGAGRGGPGGPGGPGARARSFLDYFLGPPRGERPPHGQGLPGDRSPGERSPGERVPGDRPFGERGRFRGEPFDGRPPRPPGGTSDGPPDPFWPFGPPGGPPPGTAQDFPPPGDS